MQIQWYPGHMTKTRRQMEGDLKYVDLVVELVDARIPQASRNPDLDEMIKEKPRLLLLNRVDQADPEGTRAWREYFQGRGCPLLEINAKEGHGISAFGKQVHQILKDQMARWKERGLVGRPIRAMVVGIPNVGKSTFINRVAKRKSAKVSDRPGVTRGKQWIRVGPELELLDTPGILWPKFEDAQVGLYLAFTGAVKDDVMDVETLGCHLMALLGTQYPQRLAQHYKLEALTQNPQENELAYGYRLLEGAGEARGMKRSGGLVDTQRMARILLDEYRGGKLGPMTLELPPQEGMR